MCLLLGMDDSAMDGLQYMNFPSAVRSVLDRWKALTSGAMNNSNEFGLTRLLSYLLL